MDIILGLLQIPMWLGAAIMAVYFSNIAIKEERAWKIISTGLILGFLRVIWKFFPLYETSYSFQSLRYITGSTAALLLFYGFFEYYTETTGIRFSTKNMKTPLFATTILIIALYLPLHLLPLNEQVVTNIRLLEQNTWIILSALTILIILHTHEVLTSEGLNNGFIALTIPFTLLTIYYILSNVSLLFELPTLNSNPYHNLIEGIEILSGVALIGAFSYVYKKSLSEQTK
jgi:hypothetical protein